METHARIYCFQEQSIIDSKNTLFFGQTDSFIAQAIRDTIPYFMGAVSTDELAKQYELVELKKTIRLIERQLADHTSWQEAAESRGAALLAEARQVGLVPMETRPTSTAQIFEVLRRASMSTTRRLADFTDSEDELRELLLERDNLRSTFVEVKERLEEARAFGSNRDAYEEELAQQSARLHALHLVPGAEGTVPTVCPMCLSSVESLTPKLQTLRQEMEDVSGRISALHSQNPRLQAYTNELSAQVNDAAVALRSKQEQINAVIEQSEVLKREQEMAVRRSRVQGRISAFLESESDDSNDELKA
jgi:chromosome segregation ATPase